MRIKNLLKQKGITQKELADRIGVTAPNVSLILQSKANPNLRTLERIASALGVPVSELFDAPASGRITCPYCGNEIDIKAEKVESVTPPTSK